MMLEAWKFLGVRGTVALVLAIALGIVMWRADGISADRERFRNALATEEAHHAVTRQSVDTLTLEMARLVAEGEARAERIEEAMVQVAEDTAPLKAKAERIEREGLGEDYADDLRKAGL